MSESMAVNITVRARVYDNNEPRIVDLAIAVPVNHVIDPFALDALFESDFVDSILEHSLQNDNVADKSNTLTIEELDQICPRQRYCNNLRTEEPCSICQQNFKVPKYVRLLPCKHVLQY